LFIVTSTKRRDRLLYFRISQEEFEQIQKACDRKGSRSVSDLARAAVQEFITRDSGSDRPVLETLKSLAAVVDEINMSVRQLVSSADAAHTEGQISQAAAAAAGAGAGTGAAEPPENPDAPTSTDVT
jgi:hypothetical protein